MFHVGLTVERQARLSFPRADEITRHKEVKQRAPGHTASRGRPDSEFKQFVSRVGTGSLHWELEGL